MRLQFFFPSPSSAIIIIDREPAFVTKMRDGPKNVLRRQSALSFGALRAAAELGCLQKGNGTCGTDENYMTES